jgi:hypothetical protein
LYFLLLGSTGLDFLSFMLLIGPSRIWFPSLVDPAAKAVHFIFDMWSKTNICNQPKFQATSGFASAISGIASLCVALIVQDVPSWCGAGGEDDPATATGTGTATAACPAASTAAAAATASDSSYEDAAGAAEDAATSGVAEDGTAEGEVAAGAAEDAATSGDAEDTASAGAAEDACTAEGTASAGAAEDAATSGDDAATATAHAADYAACAAVGGTAQGGTAQAASEASDPLPEA